MPEHDCAQVERDNLELHQALATALRRLADANAAFRAEELHFELDTSDLVQVLVRTSTPEDAIVFLGGEVLL